jgi:hypothetical protein
MHTVIVHGDTLNNDVSWGSNGIAEDVRPDILQMTALDISKARL